MKVYMNKYAEMKKHHQERVNALPLMFAFSQKQFKEGMERWGLTENDTDKIYKMGSTGGFYQRKDSTLIFSTFEQNEDEMTEAILADQDGTFVIGYDTPRSMKIKCDYIKEQGMLGAMYWDYAGDNEAGDLRNTLAVEMNVAPAK